MVRSRMSRKVLTAVLVPVLLFVALLSWAAASPVGASPDDDYHMASIWCGGGIRAGICEAGDSADERRVPAAILKASSCFAFQPNASASCPLPPSSELRSASRGNFNDGGYPPVFYAAMSTFAGSDISLSILLMRAFNAFLFVGLATLLFFTLAPSRRGPLIWGSIVSIVPLGVFLIPSVNPSSWAVISALTLWVAMTAYFTEQRRSRRIIFGGVAVVATVMGAGARSDAAVYSVIAIGVALVLTFEKTRKYAVLALLPFVLTVVSFLLFLSAGQAAVLTNTGSFGSTATGDPTALIWPNLTLLPQLWIGALGFWGLGWLDTTMPGVVWVFVVAMFSAVTFAGLQRMRTRKALALLMVFGSLILIPMYILVHNYVIVGAFVQPRYIYPLVIMLAGVALYGLGRDDIRLSKVQLAVVSLAIIIANAVALHVNIRRYVSGIDVQGLNLDSTIEWWWGLPISPMGVWIIGSGSFALVIVALFIYATSQRPTTSTVLNLDPSLNGQTSLQTPLPLPHK